MNENRSDICRPLQGPIHDIHRLQARRRVMKRSSESIETDDGLPRKRSVL
ncbi:MAG: hypothetical protein VB878_05265 [Pirellulaceae bacterium]